MIIAMAVTALIILNIVEHGSSKIFKTVENWKKNISTAQEDMLKAKNSGKILDHQE